MEWGLPVRDFNEVRLLEAEARSVRPRPERPRPRTRPK